MNILALETSASVAGAAVYVNGRVVSEQYLDHGLTHSQILLPLVERALRDAGLTAADIDCFAADAGPGSFTGVRIGVCTANAMAASLSKRSIGVDSLSVLAANAPFDGIISPIVDARSDRIYAAAFIGGEVQTLVGELRACTIGEWVAYLHTMQTTNILFIGDGALAHRSLLQSEFGVCAFFATEPLNRPRASACAVLAAKKIDGGEAANEAIPVYLRESQAERNRNG